MVLYQIVDTDTYALGSVVSALHCLNTNTKHSYTPGPVANEIEAHLTVQKTAVEEALAALDRELTQDSGVNGSEAEHEGKTLLVYEVLYRPCP